MNRFFSSMKFSYVMLILSGLLFGCGMLISGMANPVKVIAFLDVTGSWDMSLAFVMGGGLLVFIPIYRIIIHPRQKSLNNSSIIKPAMQTITYRLVIGAILFGIGWGMLGVCPGPLFASLALGDHSLWIFLFAMLMGSWMTKRFLFKLF